MFSLSTFVSLLNLLVSLPLEVKSLASSRLIAVDSILEDKKRLSVFPLKRLENNPGYQALEGRDRSFARALVTITERRKGQIDKILEICRKKGHKKKKVEDLWVDATLRLGAAQLLFMDVPHYAAVKETIEVLRSSSFKIPEAKIKFANAVLRRLGREGPELLASHTKTDDNITPWLLNKINDDWGLDEAKLISESFMQQSPIHLSVARTTDNEKTDLHGKRLEKVRDEIGGETCILPNGSIKVGSDVRGPVSEWPLYNEGIWWVQDAAASLPAQALFRAFQSTNLEEKHVIDMCSAPGGKMAQLVSMGFGKVTAIEISKKRCKQLEANIKRLGMEDRCSINISDGLKWTPDNNHPVDAVLLDAPCSATGTGSRRPDVLQRKDNLEELLEIQQNLLNHCVDNILQEGGVVVYATCSILKEESEGQIKKLLARTDGASMETIEFQKEDFPGFETCIDKNGWLRVLPGQLSSTSMGLCDGFFVARLRRKGTIQNNDNPKL